MPSTLNLAVAQVATQRDTKSTLELLERTTVEAGEQGVDILLFPEAFIGGYPRTATFGCSVGARTPAGRDQFLAYFRSAVDLGDTPAGADDAWLHRTLPLAPGLDRRGDGTREFLERVARQTGVFIVVGLIERCAGSLYCAAAYVCPRRGAVGKRRKVMPTGTERLVWAQGQAKSLKAVATEIRGVRVVMAAAICWESYMPLLRQSLYAQNVNLYLAPTADARDAWLSLMRTVGCEGRAFVLSANQCQRRRDLPEWIRGADGTEMEVGENGDDHGESEGQSLKAIRDNDDDDDDGEEEDDEDQQQQQQQPTVPAMRTVSEGFVEEDAWQGDGSMLTRRKSNHEIALPALTRTATTTMNGAGGGLRRPYKKNSRHRVAEKAASAGREGAGRAGGADDFVCRGGSCIVSPSGDVLAGGSPMWERSGLLVARAVDFDDCERGRLDLDVAGSYGRLDSFRLTVAGLDLNPPP